MVYPCHMMSTFGSPTRFCTRMQTKNRFRFKRSISYRPTLTVTAGYMRVTTEHVYRMNVWNLLDYCTHKKSKPLYCLDRVILRYVTPVLL